MLVLSLAIWNGPRRPQWAPLGLRLTMAADACCAADQAASQAADAASPAAVAVSSPSSGTPLQLLQVC